MDNDLQLVSAAVTDRGLSDKRPENEDSYLEMPKSGIFAVADGVGGAQAGEVASQMAMEIVGEAFANLPAGSNAAEVMKTAIERANTAIYQMAQELPQLASMASTIVALHLNGSKATIAHVGDSRLYSVDRAGELYRETEDHSMVAEEVRAGRMTEEQAENHPSKNVIMRALGAEPYVEVDIKTIAVEPGTAFLICSDGITRHVNDDEIRGVLTFGGEPVDICEYLKGLCFERGAEDNLTAVVVKAGSFNGSVAAVAHEEYLETLDFADDEVDEPTVATVRSPFESKADEDSILDLGDNFPPAATEFRPADAEVDTLEIEPEARDEIEVNEVPIVETPQPVVLEAPIPETIQSDRFSIFGGEAQDEVLEEETQKSGGGKLLAAAGSLILGAAIGIGVYHFVLVPKPVEPVTPPLTEMKSENLPFTSFEKLRRTVDSDPAAYLKEVPPADDADDFYLQGRAYLLVGDAEKARFALTEAQKRLSKTDATNTKILTTDVAAALAIANDPEALKRFKTEIENATKQPGGFGANSANTNR